MKRKTGFIKVAAIVMLFGLLTTSSLTSSPLRVGALQAAQTAAATAPAPATLPPSMANALVPCATGVTGPCDLNATKPEDIAGVWKQYLGGPFNPPSEMGYIRYNSDGTFHLADTIEHTTKPFKNYPTGTFKYIGQQWTTPIVLDDNVPAPCKVETTAYQARVLKYGDKPVALQFVLIHDDCGGRIVDYSQPLVWVAPSTQ